MIKQDQRPRLGGWAPGTYECSCVHCEQSFIGDKRAVSCADCAYDDVVALVKASVALVDAMTPEQKAEMLRKQGEGWAKSEAQWAKDFRDGKCERD